MEIINLPEVASRRPYLVDFYQMFQITRRQAENEETVKKNYRYLMSRYHPDKYRHLAGVFKTQLDHFFLNSQLGLETLTDKAKHAEYDNQLSHWKGLVSTSGFPVYDLAFVALLMQMPFSDKEIEDAIEILGFIAGFDPANKRLLEKRLKKGVKDPQIPVYLDRSLLGKQALLSAQEQRFWSKIGLPGDFSLRNASFGYLKLVKSQLEAERGKIPMRARSLLSQSQASDGRIKLINAAGEDKTQEWLANPEQGLAEISFELGRIFVEASSNLERLAGEKEQILQQRIELLDGEYQPKQVKTHGKLILCLDDGKSIEWRAFKQLDRGHCGEDESFSFDKSENLLDPKEAKKLIKYRYNIMVLKLREGLDAEEQMEEAVLKHFDRYLTLEKASKRGE